VLLDGVVEFFERTPDDTGAVGAGLLDTDLLEDRSSAIHFSNER
jgi:hypothetical protein